MLALLLATLLALDAVAFFMRSIAEQTTREKRLFRGDALQFLVCSVVLFVPGVWYMRVGLRGESASALLD